VRRFLEAHGASRFQVLRHGAKDSRNENQVVINRAGFQRKTASGEMEYLVLTETFKAEVCAAFDYRMVAGVLAERGFLECQPPDLTKRVRLPGNLGLIRAFSIKASILEG
jgi:putative DNA primase/helicase